MIPNQLLQDRGTNEYSTMLATRFRNFTSCTGIKGLYRKTKPGVEFLAVTAMRPVHGQFRQFVRFLKERYERIGVLNIWNPVLATTLARYGFEPFHRQEPDGEIVEGMLWVNRNKKP